MATTNTRTKTGSTKQKPEAGARTFDEVLRPFPDTVQELAQCTRDRVRELLPGVSEYVDTSGPYIGYGYAAGYKGQVCTIIVSKSEVKLGLSGGASLADPDGLLEGSGKVHRYIRIQSEADLRRPAVAKLIVAVERSVKSLLASYKTPRKSKTPR
jgi:hypothetical protein